MVLITILALAVLGFVGKLIYDVQKRKTNQQKTKMDLNSKMIFKS